LTLKGPVFQAECPNGCGMRFESVTAYLLAHDIAMHVDKVNGLCQLRMRSFTFEEDAAAHPCWCGGSAAVVIHTMYPVPRISPGTYGLCDTHREKTVVVQEARLGPSHTILGKSMIWRDGHYWPTGQTD